MPSTPQTDLRILFRHRPFLFNFFARGLSEFSRQVAAVAVGWQVYALTNSAFDLGIVGLMEFIPTAFLVFLAGHVADRYERKRIVQICQIAVALTGAFLAWGSVGGWLNVPEIFAAVVLLGTATAFESPAAASLLPAVTPEGTLQKGTALFTGAFQVAMISGPAVGGLAYALSPGAAYGITALFAILASILNGAIKLDRPVVERDTPTMSGMFAGISFVRRNPAILGTVSLDLFTVLLGGVTALLPIYARDILHTGPWGLGVLRAAPAAGALLMATVLARHAIQRRVRHADAASGDGLWCRDDRVCGFPLALALDSCAGVSGRRGHGKHGDPHLARAIGDPGRDAWAGWCSELSFRQCILSAR